MDGGVARVTVRRAGGHGHPLDPALVQVEKASDRLDVSVPGRSAGPGVLAAIVSREARVAVDVWAEVPRHAAVEIAVVSAEMEVEGCHGEQRYETVSGDVSLRRIAGRIGIKTVSGDVEVRAGQALSLEADAVSGDLDVEAIRLERVVISAISGDVALAGELAPGIEHRVDTVSGDLQLSTSTGTTIRVRGPAVSVRGVPGEQILGGRGTREVVIGDGRATLAFRSMSGDLEVLPAEPAPGDHEPAERAAGDHGPSEHAAPARSPLQVLAALERGEIDVDEATRRLEELSAHV